MNGGTWSPSLDDVDGRGSNLVRGFGNVERNRGFSTLRILTATTTSSFYHQPPVGYQQSQHWLFYEPWCYVLLLPHPWNTRRIIILWELFSFNAHYYYELRITTSTYFSHLLFGLHFSLLVCMKWNKASLNTFSV